MCGIAGFCGSLVNPKQLLGQMAGQMLHRGPDGGGSFYDNNTEIGMVHRRLAILDLSDSGKQPMHSASGRYVITFNGELYNHKIIRAELGISANINWIGTSDTETFVNALEIWGIERTLQKVVGMFSVAVWDAHERKLYLARDRMGEKPLYYGLVKDTFVFASELRPIEILAGDALEIDRNSLALYFCYSSIPAPYSIYKSIVKLQPGTLLIFCQKSKDISTRHYWTLESPSYSAQGNCDGQKESNKIGKLKSLLLNSVESQLMSDVPLGAFLSGGVDSSLIVSMMQQISTEKIKTFSIGFESQKYNEANHAKLVANHLGTDHHEIYMSEAELIASVPDMVNVYDEPFADASQIPTLLVSKIAKEHVSVALTGDGADELFGGYERYKIANSMWNKIGWMPVSMRRGLAKIAQVIPMATMSSFGNAGIKLLSGPSNYRFDEKNISKLLQLVSSKDAIEFYHNGFMSHSPNLHDLLSEHQEYPTAFDTFSSADGDFLNDMMRLDLLSYLPTDILQKVDRAAMFVSLETRAPFLDTSVVEFSQSLPMEYKVKSGESKWILKKLLSEYIPQELTDRPKMGFGVPLEDWLRGPLREWVETLLDPNIIKNQGFLNHEFVTRMKNEHMSKSVNWSVQLWDVIMFQSFLIRRNYSL